jgi:Domain of Unknown Function (DUF1521)
MTKIQTTLNLVSVSSERQPNVMPRVWANDEQADLFAELAKFFDSLRQIIPQPREGACQPGTVSPPCREECCHPSGSLKVDQEAGVITTPGGYKIEQIGQYEWKITGQDGKWTRIWGDPHVQESDRAGEATAWDFKRDSTFVLPDGTRINVSTKPFNNMTVTTQLEVINGNDRVLVTDIDKGKGKVGEVTHDGLAHVNDRSGRDVFVMGKETDDWYFHCREIIGSNDGGESFKLGGSSSHNDDMTQFLNQVESFALRLLNSLYGNWPTERGVESDRRREHINDEIAAVSQLFRMILNLRNLDDRLSFGRLSFQC